MQCSDVRKKLHTWMDNELPPQENDGIRNHLERCPACRAEVAAIRRVATSLEALLPLSAPASLSQNILCEYRTNLYRQGMAARLLEKTPLPDLMVRQAGLSYPFEGHQAEIRDSIGALITGLALALFGVYFLLAVPFKSFTQPLIIMFSIPFGMIGAIHGHIIMGYSLSLNSQFGVVVNHASDNLLTTCRQETSDAQKTE